MVKTRGGLSASPSSPTPRPQRAAMGAAHSPPVQAPSIPPSEGEVPSQRRYPTRRPPTEPVPPAEQAASSVSRPPAKRTRFSGPGEPSHAPQPEPATEEPRIPVDMPPEAIIRRPMIAGRPIEDFATLRSRYNGGQTGCAIPPPQPSVNVEAQNDEVGTNIDLPTDQFMEHSTSSSRPQSSMEKEITTAVDASPQLGS
eukprot:XP_010661287.1 PREDICTED: fibrous sheath CABYR-binding protein-like [Vitis vinifera]